MISFERNGNRFNHRVAGACLHGKHVLLQTAEPADFHILSGRRVEMGEDSETALKREMREEIDCEVKIENLLWIVENFFTLSGETCHEVSFIHEMKPKDEAILDPSWKRDTNDAGVEIPFEWHPLEEVEKVNLKPSFCESPSKNSQKTRNVPPSENKKLTG